MQGENLHKAFDISYFTGFKHEIALAGVHCSQVGSAWISLMQSLIQKSQYRIIVAGGSETAGVLCKNDLLSQKQCAWSARLVAIFKSVLPGKDIKLTNVASGGTTITAGLASLSSWIVDGMPDLIILDYIVNDSYEAQINIGGGSILTAYEAMIIQIHKLAKLHGKETNILFVNTCCLGQCQGINNLIRAISNFHGVLYASYYDFVEFVSKAQGADLSVRYWNTTSTHPPRFVHQMIAQVTWSCFVRAWRNSCNQKKIMQRPVISSRQSLAQMPTCESPASEFSAFNPPLSGVTGQNWKLYEDRPGKPGFILQSVNSTISFDLTFGEHPRLSIVYLRSWSGLGSMKMYVEGIAGREIILSGLYDPGDPQSAEKVSQSTTVVLQVSSPIFQFKDFGLSGVNGWAIAPYSKHKVTFQMLSGTKMKIILVQAC